MRKQKFGDPGGNAGPAMARGTVLAMAGSVRRNVRVTGWARFLRACGTPVENPGGIAVGGST